ncbi:MAG: GreA/GreB family elongation factor [Candidatus Shapirobacteria bacterium]|nr:GreA/GreB family elongation factor [Candidatus Shapirobacteria bacterium]
MNQKILLTKEGFQKLTLQLEDLKQKQSRLISQIEEVAQPDESGEDILATQLKEELEVVDNQIDEITEALEGSKIISNNINCQIVQIGCKVKVIINNKETKEFYIVSHLESDPNVSKISDQSPIGNALIGKKINDEFEIETPVGKITYKIVSIG